MNELVLQEFYKYLPKEWHGIIYYQPKCYLAEFIWTKNYVKYCVTIGLTGDLKSWVDRGVLLPDAKKEIEFYAKRALKEAQEKGFYVGETLER